MRARRSEWNEPSGRRARHLAPRPRLLIVCEGKETEPAYFRYWRHETRNNMVTVEILPAGMDPRSLVRLAAERKRESERLADKLDNTFEKYDEIWCVFDRDEHPNFEGAKQHAHANGIRLAISNPCVELWFLLHYEDRRAHIKREEVCRKFRRHHPGYRKVPPVQELRPYYEEAVRRARDLDAWQSSQGCPGRNPHTGVYALTERLRTLDREALLRRHGD